MTDETQQKYAEADAANALDIDTLRLKTRTDNCLRDLCITTVGELLSKTESDLVRARGFGRVSLHDVIDTLAKRGLALRVQP